MHRIMVEMTPMVEFDQWKISVFYAISFSISSCSYSAFYRFAVEDCFFFILFKSLKEVGAIGIPKLEIIASN